MHYFENIFFEKIPFTFWARHFDDTFTLIDNSLHMADDILENMNFIDKNIQFIYETKTMVYFLLLIHLSPASMRASQLLSIAKTWLFPHNPQLVLTILLVKT